MQVKEIYTHSIYEFAKELQDAVVEGYRISEDSLHIPQQVGFCFCANVFKEESVEESVEDTVVEQEEAPEYTPDVVIGQPSEERIKELSELDEAIESAGVNLEEQHGAAVAELPKVPKKTRGRKASS